MSSRNTTKAPQLNQPAQRTLLIANHPPELQIFSIISEKWISTTFYRQQYTVETDEKVTKKILYMELKFKGDIAANIIIKRGISQTLKRTFPAASLRIAFFSRPLLFNNLKDKIPLLTNSMRVYEFDCSSGARYIGR
ncbi:unnamed protein product [Trichobilharzia regenti]|nr:unnamed protein product [Trichobilharzia regenti]